MPLCFIDYWLVSVIIFHKTVVISIRSRYSIYYATMLISFSFFLLFLFTNKNPSLTIGLTAYSCHGMDVVCGSTYFHYFGKKTFDRFQNQSQSITLPLELLMLPQHSYYDHHNSNSQSFSLRRNYYLLSHLTFNW